MVLSFTNQNSSDLPFELVESLNQAFFLHVLVTDPTKVLPPGKSVLSMLARPRTGIAKDEDNKNSLGSLQRRVEAMVHQAFWDEALESLSDSLPSAQVSRLKFLYDDLRIALKPIIPENHTILLTLSSPLSPTPSPLHSALNHLHEILVCLRGRCAPVRDACIDSFLRRLDDPQLPLAKLIVDTTKTIIELSSVMKDDLSEFFLGTMSETQLRVVIRQQAIEAEKKWVKKLWDEPIIKQSCQIWLSELDLHGREMIDMKPRDRWILRLVQALSSTSPVSCSLPVSTSASSPPTPAVANLDVHSNTLPPPFLFTAPPLLYIQNFLQALVVTACLRYLVRLPGPKNHSLSPPPQNLDSQTPASVTPRGGDFTQRIWTLLKLEIDEDTTSQSGHTADTDTIKLVNLADEVIRARRLELEFEHIHLDSASDAGPRTASVDNADETRLRAAIERTLHSHDPVFVLLQKRLMGAITERLIRPMGNPSKEEGSETAGRGAPGHLRSGHDVAKLSKWTGSSPEDDRESSDADEDLMVKGFEDTVLVGGVREAFGKLKRCVDWMANLWEDMLESKGTA